jgi:hypothetical protein
MGAPGVARGPLSRAQQQERCQSQHQHTRAAPRRVPDQQRRQRSVCAHSTSLSRLTRAGCFSDAHHVDQPSVHRPVACKMWSFAWHAQAVHVQTVQTSQLSQAVRTGVLTGSPSAAQLMCHSAAALLPSCAGALGGTAARPDRNCPATARPSHTHAATTRAAPSCAHHVCGVFSRAMGVSAAGGMHQPARYVRAAHSLGATAAASRHDGRQRSAPPRGAGARRGDNARLEHATRPPAR